MKKFASLLLLTLGMCSLGYGTTYYSQGSVAPELFVSWNDCRTGGGNSPLNFTSGDFFIVQNGHSMTDGANWSISGAGSKLWIEDGGVLTSNFPITLAKATTFQIDNGGTFIHNNTGAPSSTIFNGTEYFCPNSTFWIKNWIGNLYVIPFGITWGNLIIDIPSLNGSWNQVGNVATVNGTLDIRQTGGNENEFRLCSRTGMTYTFNIANINVSGGILNIQGGGTTGLPCMYTIVSGDINLSGGKIDLGTNGISTISVGGNLTVSGSGIMINSSATAKIIFNNTGAQSVCLNADAMSTNLISVDINVGSTINMNSIWAMSPLATINIYGSLNTNSYTFKARAINVGGILNLGTGILEQVGTAAIIVGGPSLGNTGTINCNGVINMAPSSFASFLIQPGGVVNLNAGIINMNHTMASFFIDTGGTLNCGTGKVASINSTLSTFILNPGGTLTIGSHEGISLSETTGNIQVGGSRNFHFGANYGYTGMIPQVTGNGLPTTVNDLTINNESGVSLTNDVLVNNTLLLIAGAIVPGGKILSYSENGNLEYNGTFYSTTADVEFPSMNGPAFLTINNCAPSGIALHANRILTGSLTIADTKQFVIPAGISLTVNGSVTLNGSDCLEIMSDGSFIDSGMQSAGSGTAIVDRYITANAWHYISSPVQEACTAIFLGDYIKPYAEGTLGFGPYIVSPSVMLKPMQGYAVWPTMNHTIVFSGGKLNTGNLEADVSRTYTGQTGNNEYDGWNLVGNPYPCSIDLDLLHETWDNVEETAYFWDQSLSASGNYSVYPAKTGFGTHSQYAPAMQGFFVRCNAFASHETPGFGIIRFNIASKVHSSEIFLKKNKQVSNAIFIKVTGSANPFYDELVVHFDSNTTTGYDPGYDANKLWGLKEAPQIYTVIGNNVNLTVNALPFDSANVVVPMGFKTEISGNYEMTIDSIGTFGKEVSIILEDLKLQISQDLKSAPNYRFYYEQTDLPERFLLHFNNHKLGVKAVEKYRSLKIYSSGSDIFICNFSEKPVNGTIFLYDLVGRELVHSSLKAEQINRINTGWRRGCYLIKVVSNLGIFTRSVYLN